MSPSLAARRSDASSESPTCILLVEDEMLIRLMLADELRDAGYQVIEACDADEAVITLQTIRPDLIISDVRMPGSMDGLGLLAHVRDTNPGLPVIMVSAHLDPALAKMHGATLFIAKPFTCGALLAATEELLAGRADGEEH